MAIEENKIDIAKLLLSSDKIDINQHNIFDSNPFYTILNYI